MPKVVGDIAVQVGADVSGLQAGLKKGTRSVKDFDNAAAEMGRRFAQVGLAVATAAAGITASAISASKEITNLSRIAGVGTTEFQRLAAAGDAVGFSQEKMADIFKDVNDKFGDFMATGAGPLADFFENIAPKVGVTADEFARLSGPDALQLYVNSLEKAGVSQQQMTFYMEALANDATALIPLLRQNGEQIRALGDAAQDAGAIIDEALIKRGNELAEKWRQVMNSMIGNTYQFALKAATLIDNAFGLTDSGQLEAGRRKLNDLADERVGLLQQFNDEVDRASRIQAGGNNTEIERLRATIQATEEEMNIVNDDLLRLGDAKREREEALDRILNGGGAVDPNSPVSASGKGTKGGGGGGSSDNGLETLRDRLATQTEALDDWREEQLAKLAEYRDRKMVTEQEYNELEARINEEHAERMGRIDRYAMDSKLNAYSSALGDLASLMQSENDKLFKVGKAAAIAQAVIEGYQAASSAWQKGMHVGGPPVAAAFTAASLAKTGMLLNNIKSASPRGGGGAGASVAATPTAAQAATVSRNVVVQFAGSGDTINRREAIAMINAINEAVEDGAIVRVVQ